MTIKILRGFFEREFERGFDGAEWDKNFYVCALFGLAFEDYRAAMQGNDIFNKREAETCAGTGEAFFIRADLRTFKGLENAGAVFFGDADARVLYFDGKAVFLPLGG